MLEFEKFKNKYEKGYEEYLNDLGVSVNVLSSPPMWISMYKMIDSSLDQLITAVNAIEIDDAQITASNATDNGDYNP